MNDQRFIIEMGFGSDLHGQDYTKAAIRAVEDAIRKSSIPMFGSHGSGANESASLGLSHEEMRVQVTIGVQNPEGVNCDSVAKILPRGRAEVKAVEGGLDPSGSDIVIATAAVEAFLPSMIERFTKG